MSDRAPFHRSWPSRSFQRVALAVATGIFAPANGSSGTLPSTTLSWTAGASFYDLCLGTANPPPAVANGQNANSFSPSGLAYGTTYFWQIVAHNGGGSTAGPVWTFTTAAAPINQLVTYASDISAAALHGSWSHRADAKSPNRTKLITTDAGFASTNNALASPANYVDVTCNADVNRPSTIWLRLKALNNAKLNDLLWLQFSDAVAGGGPAYPLNTTDGLDVNLATDASASSLTGWGWQNTAYWVSQPTTLTFNNVGPHTLRIPVREDGVQLDQIVLSATTYLSTAPGPVTADSTIVPKP